MIVFLSMSLSSLACIKRAEVREKREIVFAAGVSATDELDTVSRAVARAIKKHAPQFAIDYRQNPEGTAEVIGNVFHYDLCGLNLDEAALAYYGFYEWKGKPYPQLRVLCVMGILPIVFIIAKDSGIESVHHLEGKLLGTGGEGRSILFKTKRLLEALDIKLQWNDDPWDVQVNLYKQGILVGFVKSGTFKAELEECALQRPFTILELTDHQLIKANRHYARTGLIYPSRLLRARTYPGQLKNITTSGCLIGYYMRGDVSKGVAYKILKAAWLDIWELSACYTPISLDIIGFPMLTLKYAPFPLHPGAIEFYKGVGLEIPQHMFPPEMR